MRLDKAASVQLGYLGRWLVSCNKPPSSPPSPTHPGGLETPDLAPGEDGEVTGL